MLEEALSSMTGDPADICRAFLLYLKNDFPIGGPDAEYRFFQKLYPLLLKSAFGPLVVMDEEAIVQSGGWLSRQMRWNVIPTSQQQQHGIRPHLMPHSASHVLSMDPVVHLLSPPPIAPRTEGSPANARSLFARATANTRMQPQNKTVRTNSSSTTVSLLSLIQQSYDNYYEYPFLALPQETQHMLMSFLQRQQQSTFGRSISNNMTRGAMDENDNESIIYSTLLQVKPVDQRGLVELFQLANFGPPATPGDESSPRQQQLNFQKLLQQKRNTTMLCLSAWEIYFFTFFRFPFAKTTTATAKIVQQQRESYGDSVYYHLFKSYVNYYLPHIDTNNKEDEVALRTNSELFIRLIIDFWIHGSMLTTSTEQASSKAPVTLIDVYDTIPLPKNCDGSATQQYHPKIVLKGLQYLVLHLCSDIFLEQRSSLCHVEEENFPIHNALELSDVLSAQLIILQLPTYNFIRTCLKHASPALFPSSQHNISLFLTAVEIWLIWLEPWNHSTTKLSAGKIFTNISSYGHQPEQHMMPKPTSPSKYSHPWQCYVASNAHIYTTLLAIFLRRAREFDFSQRNFMRSLDIVLRVTRVFTKDVCMVLQRSFSSAPSMLRRFRVLHEQNLLKGRNNNIFPTCLNLHDCQNDVRALLEEIYFQHFKNIREMNFLDRLDDKIEGLTGTGGSKHERHIIEIVKDQACSMVGLIGYQYTANNKQQALLQGSQKSIQRLPEVAANGVTLTEKGRREILSGKKTFVPQDVKYIGDPMKARVRSYEISFLVDWCVLASNWLNFTCGLVADPVVHKCSSPPTLLDLIDDSEKRRKAWFRFNLRFLADIRNLIFLAVVVLFWRVLRSLL